MGNDKLASLRLASAAASMALATAGVYVATQGSQATDSSQDERADDVSASIRADVERTMLTARVVSQGSTYGAPAGQPVVNTTAAEGEETRQPIAEEPETPGTGEPAEELADSLTEPTTQNHREQVAPGPTTPRIPVPVSPLSLRPGSHRDRMSPANVAAREIAIEESAQEATRVRSLGGSAGLPGGGSQLSSAAPTEVRTSADDGFSDDFVRESENQPRKLVSVDDSLGGSPDDPNSGEVEGPRSLGSDSMDKEDRHLLFVWDSSIVLDEARSAEVLTFAEHRGYDTLAVEATGVGYQDATLTDAFARFTADATAAGVETFALIGYPWFTVAANAGLPGQPTSSAEGVAVLDVIAATGLFDGVVDDSHPYGVTYEVDGESRNWLFDEPAAASLDLQAWLRSAKEAVGDLPLIKTTPFWYDSHPALQEMVNLEGEGFLTLGHLVATEVDAMAVLAYRDSLDGPNGLLELVAGEMSMGPSIITFETGNLGSSLDYLTFHEEGPIGMAETTEKLVDHLLGEWAFAGVGVHHYEPIATMAAELAETQSIGFAAFDSATAEFGALIDAYDSSLGTYTDQMTFNAELDTMTGIGLGALVSNGDIELKGGALVHGDARAGQLSDVTQGDGAIVTGEAISIYTPLEAPDVDAVDSSSGGRGDIGWNRGALLNGSGTFSRIQLSGYARLTIAGPATVVIGDLTLSNNAYIWADTTNGPVTLHVEGRLEIGDSGFIAPSSKQAKDLLILQSGTGTLQIGEEARLLADVIAPGRTIEMNRESEIYGRAAAQSMNLQREAKLHFDIDLLR